MGVGAMMVSSAAELSNRRRASSEGQEAKQCGGAGRLELEI